MEASIYRMRQQDVLTVCVLALLALGAVMVQSASVSLTGCVVRATAPNPDAPRPPGPAAVADVIAATSAGGIDLTWSHDSASAVVAYRVYRTDTDATEYEQLAEVKKPATSYRDTSVPAGESHRYRVTAVDDLGRESAPAELAAVRPGNWNWTILGGRHFTYVLVAFATFLAVGHVRYTKLLGRDDGPGLDEPTHAGPFSIGWAKASRSPILWATAIALLACLAVLVPGVGSSVNGARRWIKLGPVQIQPSELAKWATVLFLAWWLTRPATRTTSFVHGFIPAVVPIALLCLLVVIQDFGTAALIGVCGLTMLVAGRVKPLHVVAVAVPAALAGVWFITHKGYRLRRIMAFRDPYASPQGEGYHMIQSLLSFSTGGVLGRGLGNGVQKLGYLPEDTTDFIFAVICEELGLFGALLVIALYLGVIYVAWQTVRQKADDFGRLLAFGVGSMVGLQAAINIAVATVSVPTKGLSLPLVSAGGSGLIITCAALGLLYSVTRYAPDAATRSGEQAELDPASTPEGVSLPVAT